jgi:hypothetical protein
MNLRIKNGYENEDWIPLIQDMVQWRAVLKSNEPSGSIKRGNILDQLSDYSLLKMDFRSMVLEDY